MDTPVRSHHRSLADPAEGTCRIAARGAGTAPKVLVVIGSAWRARDAHNPFTWTERQQQFEAVLTSDERARVSFCRCATTSTKNAGTRRCAPESRDWPVACDVTLVGFRKDHTSTYLDHFPGWQLHEVEPHFGHQCHRPARVYFEAADMQAASRASATTSNRGADYLEAWAHLPAYRRCAAEHRAIVAYRAKYGAPVSLTADACSPRRARAAHRARRRHRHGLWAFPGDSWIRANGSRRCGARAGRGDRISGAAYRACSARFKGEAVFDHPGRSSRGRIVTMAFHFDLGDERLPEVGGRDDAGVLAGRRSRN